MTEEINKVGTPAEKQQDPQGAVGLFEWLETAVHTPGILKYEK